MEESNDHLQAVQEMFPSHETLIERLWSEDADFRELCRACRDCAAAHRHWCAEAGVNSERAQEYRKLLGDLRRDVGRCLDVERDPAEQDRG